MKRADSMRVMRVAPRAGARIETGELNVDHGRASKSPPVRGRGLKLFHGARPDTLRAQVAPRAGARIET